MDENQWNPANGPKSATDLKQSQSSTYTSETTCVLCEEKTKVSDNNAVHIQLTILTLTYNLN